MSGQSYLGEVFPEVSLEGLAALGKFGPQTSLTDLEWFAILAEEVGEVAMDVTKREVRPVTLTVDSPTSRDLRSEIVQVAAVAMRWLRAIDERDNERDA